MEPTKIYVKSVIPALRTHLVKGFAHITGGGLIENIPRILPENMDVTLDANKWNILPIFSWLAAIGRYIKSKFKFLKIFCIYIFKISLNRWNQQTRNVKDI